MPGRFVVKLTSSFERDLKKLSHAVQSDILQECRALESSPFSPPPKIKKLKGKVLGSGGLRCGRTGCDTMSPV